MSLVIHCPTCRHPLSIDAAQVGTVVTCPTCRSPLGVPPIAEADPEPAFVPTRRPKKPRYTVHLAVIAVGFVATAAAGVWLAVRPAPKPADLSSAEPVAQARPEPVPPVLRRVDAPVPIVTPPKRTEPPKHPEPVPPAPEPKPAPPKPLTFDDAVAEVERLALLRRKEGEAEVEKNKKLFTAKEEDLIRVLLRTDPAKVSPDGLPCLTTDQEVTLSNLGLGRLATALRCQWAVSDPGFRSQAKRVWDRSPKMRSVDGVTHMADRWGSLDSLSRGGLSVALGLIEKGNPDRFKVELYRKDIIDFAGTEYYANRP
ncbi:hypothetical protein [Gemmata sp.]|uniref:hypothetical protein n=1 Tax=Gemmata sp. TaxID=1914242 RepID=UPI003F704233